MTRTSRTRTPPDAALRELMTIPGVGPSIAGDLKALGIRRVSDLRGKDPERLYERSNRLAGEVQDRCLLYVFRCAVYYASTAERRRDPGKLKWWNWKDERRPAPRNLVRALVIAVTVFSAAALRPAVAQQAADSAFAYPIASPAYPAGEGPKVLVDEAHHNFHTTGGRFLAFARLLGADGYAIAANTVKFSRESLSGAKILVVSNALAAQNEDDWSLPTPSAFDSSEIVAVREWVREGGSLWLIADHMPFPGAAGELAAEFGILMSNGFATDESEEDGRMTFTRAAGSRRGGTLADHPITRGRNDAERVDSVVSFTGQAFRLDAPGNALMTLGGGNVVLLPTVAWQFSKLTQRIPASGMLQGAALTFGKGRVAVFGEAAMFSAQLAGPNRAPVGMNDPSAPQNPRFVLNVAHWLDGLLDTSSE